MKHLFLLLSFFAIATTQAQTQDTLFVWKAGIVVNKQSIKPADMDSITFKRPVTTNPLGITTAAIPAGTFLMGSPTTEPNRNPDETQHTVTLNAFSMSTREITCAQFAAFCNANDIEGDGLWAEGLYPTQLLFFTSNALGLTYVGSDWVPATGKANAPMVAVTWYGAAAFAQYAGGRLPTEAEWEYAARATTTTAFNTGACLSDSQANYRWQNPQTGCTNSGANFPATTQNVGTYAPNAWGLYEIHGNAWEWCSDWYGDYPTNTLTNPAGPATGSTRVFRGGGLGSNAQNCRSARRGNGEPTGYYDGVGGFRIVF